MSLVYRCDVCRRIGEPRSIPSRLIGVRRMPKGWTQHGSDDVCEQCSKNMSDYANEMKEATKA